MLSCPCCYTRSKLYSQYNTYICPKCGVCFNSQTSSPLSRPELLKLEAYQLKQPQFKSSQINPFQQELFQQSLSLFNSIPPVPRSRILLEKQLAKYLDIYRDRLLKLNKVIDENKTLCED